MTTIIVSNHSSGSSSSYAKKIACQSYEQSFNKLNATIEQKQKYANCIDILYPQMTSGEIIFIKFIILLSISLFIIGYWKGYRFKNKGDHVAAILLAMILSTLIPFIIFLFFIGIKFIFS